MARWVTLGALGYINLFVCKIEILPATVSDIRQNRFVWISEYPLRSHALWCLPNIERAIADGDSVSISTGGLNIGHGKLEKKRRIFPSGRLVSLDTPTQSTNHAYRTQRWNNAPRSMVSLE